jgi:hypothetical protein
MIVTREEAQDMSQAHAEGWHTPPDGVPREGCPDCEDRPLSDYPPAPPLDLDDVGKASDMASRVLMRRRRDA